tara:strand:- start:246 stop:1100 length:855 start_codon:yes stop_codon:yes gene_type:complete
LRLYFGAVLISFSPIFVSLVHINPTASAFFRVFIGGIALTLYLLISKKRFDFNKSVWFFLFMASIFFAADLWFWHRSVIYVGPGLGTLLANMQVFIMMMAGIFLYKQMPTRIQLFSIPFAVIGLFMIVGLDWNELKPNYQMGIIFGLLTAICYSSYLISMRQAQQSKTNVIPIREVAVMSLMVSMILALTAFFENESLIVENPNDYLILLIYGIGSHAIGGIMIASALVRVSTTEVGIALLLQPTLSFIWEILFFNRSFSLIESVGVIIVLYSIFLSSNRTARS